MDMKQFDVNAYDTSDVSPEWTYDNLTDARKRYVDMILKYGEDHGIKLSDFTFSRKQLRMVSLSFKDNDDVPNWIVKDHDRRATQGVYFIPEVAEKHTGESQLDSIIINNNNTSSNDDESPIITGDDGDNDDDYCYVGDDSVFTADSTDINDWSDQ